MNDKLFIVHILFILLLVFKFVFLETFIPGPALPYIKNVPLNLNNISKISGYKYYVGGGLANSYHTYGFRHSEIKKYFPFMVDNQVQVLILKNYPFVKINRYEIIKKERLAPYLSLAMKELLDYNVKMVTKFNKLQNAMTKIQQKEQKEKAKKHLG